ncbi:MAG TPA: hypothetical protein VFU49_00340 [Ktedonobacteraceae bacterium]|nr:hypothetical protein [Ktedonobacteraceae bacterium]
MSFPRYIRSIALGGTLLMMLLTAFVQSGVNYSPTAHAASLAPAQQGAMVASVLVDPTGQQARQGTQHGRLAPTTHVLDSLAPTTILQFPLVPSGIKGKFPNAQGLVTIVRGDRNASPSDTVTVDVQNMPPNITFTIFFIQFANKPFGNVQYVADLTTRGDGTGETIFHIIAFVAFAMDARNPGTSTERVEGIGSGTNLEHMGMWFSSLKDAQQVLNDGTLKGTIFDGGSPPLHAGPQAMTDGQTDPVF